MRTEKKSACPWILGTMTIGMQIFPPEVEPFLRRAETLGVTALDAAYVYNGGETERLLGEAFRAFAPGTFQVAAKVNPKPTGNLSPETVRSQLEASLARMGLAKADILYLHFPTRETPLEQTLEVCEQLRQEGKFDRLGLSNFPCTMVEQVAELALRRRWPGVQVYQGVYSALSRSVEGELLPLLRQMGASFVAYNPLAGGLLTGKYSDHGTLPAEGRFVRMTGYQGRYWSEENFRALASIREVCREHGIAMADGALRWLLYHSGLNRGAGDKVLLGASRLEQLEANVDAVVRGPLPKAVCQAFAEAWEVARPADAGYWRFL